MITPRAVVGLIVGALGLPIGMCVLFALARLLEAMKDESVCSAWNGQAWCCSRCG